MTTSGWKKHSQAANVAKSDARGYATPRVSRVTKRLSPDYLAVIALQRAAGNHAVSRLVGSSTHQVQRCGSDTSCGCSPDGREQAEPSDAPPHAATRQVQRKTRAPVSRLIPEQGIAQQVQRCGGHVDVDCATCDPVTVSRQANGPVIQRQPTTHDPWAEAPVAGTVTAPSGAPGAGPSVRVVQDNIRAPGSGELEGLLGLPPESIPPGALSNPDFLLSLAANTPGASAARLEEVVGAPDAVAAAIPEGKVVEVDENDLMGLPKQEHESHAPVHEIHGAVRGADHAVSHHLAHHGYNSAGPNAIGIVAFPQSRLVRFGTGPTVKNLMTPGPLLPESKIVLGHTAVYVRIDNKIHLIRSYAPVSLADAAINFGRVRSGTGGVPAQIVDHLGNPHPPGGRMFDITSGRSIEYAVPKDLAIRFADSLPEGGSLPGELYTAQPETAAKIGSNTRLCMGRNCVHWAVGEVEKTLGAPVGPKGQSVVNIGGIDRARQGKMQDLLTPDPKRPLDSVRFPAVRRSRPSSARCPPISRSSSTAGGCSVSSAMGCPSTELPTHRKDTRPRSSSKNSADMAAAWQVRRSG